MTADDLFTSAIALVGGSTSDKVDYTDAFIPVLNIILAETFDVNNSIRVYKELAELTTIPTVTATTDTMTYEDEILRRVIPYGIAGTLYQEDNASLAAQYMNKYDYARMNAYKAAYVEITDYYAGDDEE